MKDTTTPAIPIPTVVLREQSMEQHSGGSITGIVFWKCNGHSFPDSAWNDFIIVILGWWVQAIARLIAGTTTTETMDFMDGPYSILCKTTNNSIDCQFVDRHSEVRAVASWTGQTRELASVIFSAGKLALRVCHTRGLANADLETLEREVRKLQRLM